MVVAGVMFGNCYNNVYAGMPQLQGYYPYPVQVSLYLILAHLGMILLVLCIWLLIVQLRRLTKYDIAHPFSRYACGHIHVQTESYFDCRCARLEKYAVVALFVGSATNFACSVFLQISKYYSKIGDKGHCTTATSISHNVKKKHPKEVQERSRWVDRQWLRTP